MSFTPLRHISVHVDEPDEGVYVWVLMERAGDLRWAEIQRATSGEATYRQAMADGLVALQAMVDDLEVGPRGAASRSGAPGPSPSPSPPGPQKPSKPFFGFGPAR